MKSVALKPSTFCDSVPYIHSRRKQQQPRADQHHLAQFPFIESTNVSIAQSSPLSEVMLTLLGTRLYVPRSQQQEPPAISSSSAASTSSLLQRYQSSDQNELPYQSSPSASAATDPSYPSNAIASLLTSSTAGSSNPLSLAQKDHLLTETFPHLTSLRATSHRYSEASKSQKLQVAEAKSRLDEARLELENRRLEEMELMEEIRRETSNE